MFQRCFARTCRCLLLPLISCLCCVLFPRALVFIAHGAGEHSGPYDELAQRLKELSLLAFAHDHGERPDTRAPPHRLHISLLVTRMLDPKNFFLSRCRCCISRDIFISASSVLALVMPARRGPTVISMDRHRNQNRKMQISCSDCLKALRRQLKLIRNNENRETAALILRVMSYIHVTS